MNNKITSFEQLEQHMTVSIQTNNLKDRICYVEPVNDELLIEFELGNELIDYVEENKVGKLNFICCKFRYPLTLNQKFFNSISDQTNSEKHKSKLEVLSNLKFTFGTCTFTNGILLNNLTYNNNFRFWKCHFHKLNIYNASFNKLFEIVNSCVYSVALFNKVDFNSNCVFTNTKFYKNCFFTYSTFEKQGIFSRAQFINSGLDLSQSIINGNLTFFETQLDNYTSVRIDSLSKGYDKAITEEGKVPTQNKRETFRIIKQQLVEQHNLIEAEKYAKLEKQTFLEEKNLEAIFENNVLKTFKILLSDYIVLKLNKYSNNFKTSWVVALVFILTISILSHSLLSICPNYDFNDYVNVVKLINLTDFSLIENCESQKFYVAHFMTKIFISFGIYQFIQAFRKFR